MSKSKGQKTSLKSYETEIKIRGNPGLTYRALNNWAQDDQEKTTLKKNLSRFKFDESARESLRAHASYERESLNSWVTRIHHVSRKQERSTRIR